jgi:hypothetical protein
MTLVPSMFFNRSDAFRSFTKSGATSIGMPSFVPTCFNASASGT